VVVHGSRSGEVLGSFAGGELRLGAAKLSKRPVGERRSEESSYRGNGGRGIKKGTNARKPHCSPYQGISPQLASESFRVIAVLGLGERRDKWGDDEVISVT
jgi:hypothetical protein